MQANELKAQMQQYTGTTTYHKLTVTPLLATDGVLMTAQMAGAFWLVDTIGSYQTHPALRTFLIQFWTLEVKGSKAELYCVEDCGKPKVISQQIDYTDFPEGSWKFYVQNCVMMLPQEY